MPPTAGRHRRQAGVLLLLLLLLSSPGTSRAYDFEVSARTEGYGYQLRRYEQNALVFVNRRRITQYLGLRIFNLLDPGEDPFAPDSTRPPALLTFHALMRFFTDVGGYGTVKGEIPEYQENQLDLVLGGLDGRNILGRVDFTLGRQYDMELFDFYAYDGLSIRLNLPLGFFLRSHFGVQVARAHPLSAAVLQTDGAVGDGTDDAWSPTFGVSAGLQGPRWIEASISYRGTASMAPAELEEETVWGMDEEVLYVHAGGQLPLLGIRPRADLRYSLLSGQVDDIQVSLSQRIGVRHDVELELLRSLPHFDGDSIFNIFSSEPYTEVAGRYSVQILEPLGAHVRFGYRHFWTDEAEGSSAEPDALAAGAGCRWLSSVVRASGEFFALTGEGGTTLGGDLAGTWRPLDLLAVEGRLSVIDYQGASLVTANGLGFGLQVGVSLRFFRGVLVHVLLEDNISPLYRSALRLLGVLDLEFAP